MTTTELYKVFPELRPAPIHSTTIRRKRLIKRLQLVCIALATILACLSFVYVGQLHERQNHKPNKVIILAPNAK